MRRTALVVLLAVAVLVAGYFILRPGRSDDSADNSGGGTGRAPGGGTLAVAAPALPDSLDPLHARTPLARAIVRQLTEPLVARVKAPEGRGERSRGLAVSLTSSRDARVWRLQLRSGVRFQDGAPFNAEAVRANAERWRTTKAGRRLLPGLRSSDAPQPSVVRMVFRSPQPNLPSSLAAAGLGVVSPRALDPHSGRRARFQNARSGTGPFQVRGWRPGRLLELERYGGWWGTPRGLGPSLVGVRFRALPEVAARARAIGAGQVTLVTGMPPAVAAALRSDPNLLVMAGSPGPFVAQRRSLRGIDPTRLGSQSFSSAWFTRTKP